MRETNFFERIVKLSKGKCSLKLDGIRKRHDTSEAIDASAVSVLSDTEYAVASSGNSNYTVAVLKSSVCKPDNCLLRCLKCNICIHMFSCTCPDYSVAANMCKHICERPELKLAKTLLKNYLRNDQQTTNKK